MKIHNFGNDYVQARKFQTESVDNVGNRNTENEPNAPKQVHTQVSTEAEEAKPQVKKFGKKKIDNKDNV